MSTLKALCQYGQSLWLDTIDRHLVQDGGLAQLVKEGISGLTSNPTIFEKAITASPPNDPALRAAIVRDRYGTTEALYEALAIEDIRMAADILRPVYDETGGADGLVSLEVSPHLAHDTAGTISEAKRLVLYVEDLIGPATVNTMPLATLNAFRDHGQPRASLTEGLDEAEADLDRLVRLEIDLA